MSNNEEIIEVKKCKKCGCELASDTKGNLCLNCKKKKGKWLGMDYRDIK